MPGDAQPVFEVKANLFRVLGHPARVRILELLRDGERSVGALQLSWGWIRVARRSIWPPCVGLA